MYKRPAYYSILLTLLAAVLLSSCRKKEFHVEFNLPQDVNETVSLIDYASDAVTGWLVEQVVTLNKGKAEVIIPAVRPALVYVNKAGALLPSAIFYSERGDNFKVTGKGSDPLRWDIRGNEITDKLTEWRLASADAIEKWRRSPREGAAELNRLVAGYVAKNPSDPVSAILLLTYYDRRADEAGFQDAMAKLKDEARDENWVELASLTDMIDYMPAQKLPERIVLKTGINGCDTIVPGRVPTILFFTPRNYEMNRAQKDTIRKLSREFKDSSKRVIADISFERDSMSRVYAARKDSFTKVVHAWMPLGISDSTAKVLGVHRAPWVIVIDKKKNVLYSGSDMSEATKLIRRELK